MSENHQDTVEEKTQKQILDIIVGKDDVSWKAIIFGLIENEQMDPWDINISLIAAKFLEELKKLQEMDFRISGKVVLASAILLKLKAEKLRDEDIMALERFIQTAEEPVDLGLEEFEEINDISLGEKPQLIPRTPQPRKRKVSVYDLVEALEKALEMDARRPAYQPPRVLDTIDPPEHHIDISVIIREVYDRIYGHYEMKKEKSQLMFHHIARSTDKQDMVMTFIPLLHLENARKVEMEQPEHFGPINVHLLDKSPPAFLQETQTRIKEEPLPPKELQAKLAHGEAKQKSAKKKVKKPSKQAVLKEK
jgi:chromatin segregation and condensation protein Rec8/ScpA/Scc1 (kleisin family)